jgi:hypothetical protein
VAFFTRRGDAFQPTELTRGPWDPDAQHAGPPCALVARALERVGEPAGKRIGRVTFEILGPVPLEELRVEARVVRPGRSVELLEATLAAPGGMVMRASAWRLRTEAVALDPEPEAEPTAHGPADGEPREIFPSGHGGYQTAVEHRFIEGAFLEPGPATVWMRLLEPLVDGEEPSPLQRVAAAADSGNGVSSALDFRRFLFINTDLTIHLHRPPDGEWVCLEAVTRLEPDGVGMADTLLWDERGRIGRAAQTLLLRERV